jgi:hydroxymethylpyrimidine/phosphomethylpyrimidine kinase
MHDLARLARTIGAVASRIRTPKIPNVLVEPVMVAASGDILFGNIRLKTQSQVQLKWTSCSLKSIVNLSKGS